MECDPVIQTWKTIAECMPPQTYTEMRAFLGLVGHYRRSIKGFLCIAQPLNKHLAGEEASRKSGWVSLSGHLEGFWGIETGMHDNPSFGFHWLHQTILAGDWCVQGWIRGSAVTEAGRQMISPCCLWQQSPHASWEELLTWLNLISWHWSG